MSRREIIVNILLIINEVFKNDNINSSYEVKDIWENYYRVFSIINIRYNDWKIKNEYILSKKTILIAYLEVDIKYSLFY